MPKNIYFKPLGSADACRISHLQKKLFPAELTESEDEIRHILQNTEEHLVCNLSYGLFDGTRMVGYVFAYVETESIFHRRKEEVVYIKEIALTPGYEGHLRPLFQKLFAQWLAYAPHLPLEAHTQADALENWKRLNRVFRYYGLTLQSIAEAGREGRPPYQLLRLDVADATVAIPEQPAALPKEHWKFNDDMTVSVVKDPRQWLSLRALWADLLRKTDHSTVFQSFEYLSEWWKHFGIWNELHVIVIHRAEAVVGVVPFMIEYARISGRIVRKMRFIGTPSEVSRPKFLFGHDSDACLPTFLAYLENSAADWDVLEMAEQLEDKCTDAVRNQFRRMHLVAEAKAICPYIDLKGTWEQFLVGCSQTTRSDVERLRNDIASMGAVNIRTVRSWPATAAALDVYCEVEEESWRAEERLCISDDKSRYFFYKGLARVFGQEENFVVRTLECGGKPLASTFGIVRDQVLQSLKTAFDDEFDRLSPGIVLESYELESLFGEDVSRYEFMGGGLAPGLRWTSTAHKAVNLHVYRRQPRLMLYFFGLFVLKPRLKAVLKKTGLFDKVERFIGTCRKSSLVRYPAPP